MNIALVGLQDFQRKVEAIQEAFSPGSIQRALDLEIDHLYALIKKRMGNLSSYVKIDYDNDSVYLQYRINEKEVTARDYHNPASKRFNITKQGQPFQDVLAEEGYVDIEPDRGVSIPVSHHQAPGVRLRARMGPEAIRRIKRYMGLV